MTKTCRAAVILLLLLGLAGMQPARGEILSDQLPAFGGDTFAAEVLSRDAEGLTKSQALIWNIDGDLVSAYVYEPETMRLKALYVAKALVVRGEGSWWVSFAGGKGTLFIRETRGGQILMNGARSDLRRISEGEVVALRAARPTAEKEEAGGCVFFCAFNGCCSCCFCVHRALGVPEILDVLCCGFGCNAS